jgi:hypothetical protein
MHEPRIMYTCSLLSHDGKLIDEWCVYLEHPVNKDDFVVAYRAKEQADCEPVRFALNTLIQAHWNCD